MITLLSSSRCAAQSTQIICSLSTSCAACCTNLRVPQATCQQRFCQAHSDLCWLPCPQRPDPVLHKLSPQRPQASPARRLTCCVVLQIQLVPGSNTYTIAIINGRPAGCANNLGVPACGATSTQPLLQTQAISNTGAQQWIITPAAALC